MIDPKMAEQDFANLQRILASYPATSRSIVGFYISVNLAGVAGLYSLGDDHKWASCLSILCWYVSILFCLMWYREHITKKKTITMLKEAHVTFPDDTDLKGSVTCATLIGFGFGILFWPIVVGLKVFAWWTA